MKSPVRMAAVVVVALLLPPAGVRADEGKDRPNPAAGKVYGEWLIRPRTDQRAEYRRSRGPAS